MAKKAANGRSKTKGKNIYDQAFRHWAKIYTNPAMEWLNRRFSPPLRFISWLDSRTITLPGGRERIVDLLALCERIDRPGVYYILHIEVERKAKPGMFMLFRLLEYDVMILGEELSHNSPRHLVSCAVYLQGAVQLDSYKSTPADDPCGISIKARSVFLRKLDAKATIEEIETGQSPKEILPLIPLMKNGGRPDIIERWKVLLRQVQDENQANDLAALTKAFAQATRSGKAWNQAVGDWDVRKSSFIDEYVDEALAEGVVKGVQDNICRILKKRFGKTIPTNLEDKIRKQTDNEILSAWLDMAYEAKSLSAYENQINQVAAVPQLV